MSRRPLIFVLALSCAGAVGACGGLGTEGDEGAGPPCEDDFAGCSDDASKFMEDPSCTLTGELELELGQGETEFSALAPGELPDVNDGIQGGQHLWMALRVRNPDLDRQQLKIRIRAEYCDSDCESVDSWVVDNLRELVADASTMTITGDGAFEQTRMLVTIDAWAEASERRVDVLVTDPCGRQGLVVISTVD